MTELINAENDAQQGRASLKRRRRMPQRQSQVPTWLLGFAGRAGLPAPFATAAVQCAAAASRSRLVSSITFWATWAGTSS